MTDKTKTDPEDQSARRVIDMLVRLGLVGLLAIACAAILAPFVVPVVWAVILAVTVRPIHDRLTKAIGGRHKTAALLLTASAVAVLMIPTALLTISSVKSGLAFAADIHNDTLVVPEPSEALAEWPVIGPPLHDAWTLANENVSAALVQFADEIKGLAAWLIGTAGKMLLQVIAFCASIAIAGVFLAFAKPGQDFMQGLGRRLSPANGERLVDLATQTTRSVAKGVLGVAAIQSLLSGIGMLVAGVPAAGLWALAVLFVAIIQLPPILVLLPLIAWNFTVSGTVAASVLAVWLLAVSSADAVLKPMLLGRGLEVPMPIILLGAIGGMLASGIIGLFAGAVVLAIGHTLFMEWLDMTADAPDGSAGGSADGSAGEAPALSGDR